MNKMTKQRVKVLHKSYGVLTVKLGSEVPSRICDLMVKADIAVGDWINELPPTAEWKEADH